MNADPEEKFSAELGQARLKEVADFFKRGVFPWPSQAVQATVEFLFDDGSVMTVMVKQKDTQV